jgi:hypothetical protein
MPQTLAQGQRAAAGWVITQGMASSGVCQDPNGCYAEPMNAPAPQVPVYQPGESSIDRNVASVVIPDAPAPAPQAPAPAPATTSDMLGLPQQAPQMCTPENGCRPAPINLGSSAQRITGIPGMNPGFNASSGADPYEVWRARQWMEGFKTKQDPNKAVATAGVAGSQARAADLMRQGVDYQTAVGLAQREQMDRGGYRAAGIASGATGATTQRIDQAAQLEAERQFMRGGSMAPAGSALFPAAPGTMFTGLDGQIYQSTTGTAQTLGATPAALADPFTAAAMLSGQRGLPLSRVKAAQAAAAAERKQELVNAGGLARTQAQGADRLKIEQARQTNRTNRTWRDKVDAQTLDAAENAYEDAGGSATGIPFELYFKAWAKDTQGKVATLPPAGSTASAF